MRRLLSRLFAPSDFAPSALQGGEAANWYQKPRREDTQTLRALYAGRLIREIREKAKAEMK